MHKLTHISCYYITAWIIAHNKNSVAKKASLQFQNKM